MSHEFSLRGANIVHTRGVGVRQIARRGPNRRRVGGERGAALVEFALILPLLLAFLLAIFTGGLAYNQKLNMTHATREGARYGATIDPDQTFSSGSWAANVQTLAVTRAIGDLSSAQVCVSLVTGAENSPTVFSDGTNGQSWYTTKTVGGSPAPCFSESSSSTVDIGKRVQISTSKPTTLQWILLTQNVTITARAESRLGG